MATINLGAIKFNWKGAYNSSTTYAVDDVVSSGGNSYVCIQAHSNQAVGDATAYWNIMSSAGTNGTNGTDVGTTLTTQGDILYRDGSGLARLGYGTAGQVLQTGGTGANPSWTDAGGGHLLAFYNHVNQSNETTTSSTFQASLSTLTITPASTSSKFLILSTFQGGNDTASRRSSYAIFRGSSQLGNSDMQHEFVGASSNENPSAMQVYDSPNTTSAITYNVRYHGNVDGGDTAKINFKQLSIFEFAS